MERIRNFVIISHVDHGKSTLADRFLELTGAVEQRKMREQYLDRMDLERERGITIKMQPVRMLWHPASTNSESITNQQIRIFGKDSLFVDEYILNLIDTPGHADFSYEVSRALAAVEGAILLVDATQGVQAQTVAVVDLARSAGLTIIPAVNKIDLPSARVTESSEELSSFLGCSGSDIHRISGKTGEGVRALLDALVSKIPEPSARAASGTAAQALVFDSHFDSFRGVIAHVRIFSGAFRGRERVAFLATGATAELQEVGYFLPELAATAVLGAGDIGYLATGLKEPDAVRVGDTVVTGAAHPSRALLGYRAPQPVVFASIYPEDPDAYERLRDALQKAKLNDAAISFEPERSNALGRGFRIGCLGLLHMEVVGERLRREYGLRAVFAAPSVAYRLILRDGGQRVTSAAAEVPDASALSAIEEPWVLLELIVPQRFRSTAITLIRGRRGMVRAEQELGSERAHLHTEAPLREIVVDFADALKSATQGYGSFSYQLLAYRPGDLVRLDVLVAGEREPALSEVVPRTLAYAAGRAVVARLKEHLPRQLFPVALQAASGGRIIARETIPALKKDVTGYLYGGDRSRKMKLWKKQQRGKRRLAARGRVAIPPAVFLALRKR